MFVFKRIFTSGPYYTMYHNSYTWFVTLKLHVYLKLSLYYLSTRVINKKYIWVYKLLEYNYIESNLNFQDLISSPGKEFPRSAKIYIRLYFRIKPNKRPVRYWIIYIYLKKISIVCKHIIGKFVLPKKADGCKNSNF